MTLLGRLHELDGGAVRIANIDHPFSSVRTRAKCLWFARGAPPGCGDSIQDSVKILDRKRDVHLSNIARSKIDMFSVLGCEVFKQLDFVSVAFHNGD